MIKTKSVAGGRESKKDKSKWAHNANGMKKCRVPSVNLLDILLLNSVANERN